MKLGQVFEIGPLQLQAVEVYFRNAGAIVGARHSLQNAPIGYIPIRQSAGCKISDGARALAKGGVVPLICDTAGVTATILVVALNLTER